MLESATTITVTISSIYSGPQTSDQAIS